MNCELVFDILTRGPFPTGEQHDSAVERHLACCYECRQLAEGLRPALSLFHEAIKADEADNLPGYRGVLGRTDSACLAATMRASTTANGSFSAGLRLQKTSPATRETVTSWWHFAAAGLLAVALGAVLWGLGYMRPGRNVMDDRGTSAAVTARSHQPDQQGQRLLASLNLPTACWQVIPAGLAEVEGRVMSLDADSLAAQGYRCCTECHSAANEKRPPVDAVATVAGSCRICHDH